MRKSVKFLLILAVPVLMCGNVNAQWGGIENAIKRGVERAVEKQTEKQVEKAIENTPYTPDESEWAFFATKKGTVQTFVSKDGKGKITAQSRSTITDITGSKEAFAIDYQTELLNAKGKPVEYDGKPMTVKYRVIVKDRATYLDLKSMFGAMEGLGGVDASGTAMIIPGNLSVGQTLPDASAQVKAGFINCIVTMTECKVLAEESVTTEAGTFQCFKVSQKVNSSVMGIKTEGTTLSWYAKGVGTVKTEMLDKKGNVMQTQELTGNS